MNMPISRANFLPAFDERAPPHSITSSARASSVGGTVMPIALAVASSADAPRLSQKPLCAPKMISTLRK
jgi:hypothetical protein